MKLLYYNKWFFPEAKRIDCKLWNVSLRSGFPVPLFFARSYWNSGLEWRSMASNVFNRKKGRAAALGRELLPRTPIKQRYVSLPWWFSGKVIVLVFESSSSRLAVGLYETKSKHKRSRSQSKRAQIYFFKCIGLNCIFSIEEDPNHYRFDNT